MKACLTALCVCAASLLFEALAVEPEKDARKDFLEIKAKAETGDAESQMKLGLKFDLGSGVKTDKAEAAKWYRKAAEQGNADAQYFLGSMYAAGQGVQKDEAEAVKWYRKAAEQGNAAAQVHLGIMYANGRGVPRDEFEAVKWFRKAVEKENADAQVNLGVMYANGRGVPKDAFEAVKWFRKAAEVGNPMGQYHLGNVFANGLGMPKDDAEAYKWLLLAGAQGVEEAKRAILFLEGTLSPNQRAEGQRMAREFKPRQSHQADSTLPREGIAQSRPQSSGTGFFITDDGYFITNQHVADEGSTVRLVTAAGSIAAKVVKVDKANDLALLKAEGRFTALPVITSRGVRLGATAATVGFPNTGLQGFAPKLAKGEVASLAGVQDDARHFQISAPIQPGNSGGAQVDERGNVIGVVVAKLSQRAALATSGALAENVNYAVKSSYLLSFLESVPEVAAKLKEAHTKERKFEDVVKSVEQATVLVLVY